MEVNNDQDVIIIQNTEKQNLVKVSDNAEARESPYWWKSPPKCIMDCAKSYVHLVEEVGLLEDPQENSVILCAKFVTSRKTQW